MVARLTNFVILTTSCFFVTQASVSKREVADTIAPPSQTLYPNSQSPGIQLQSGSVSYLLPDSQLSYTNVVGGHTAKGGILEKIKLSFPAVIKDTTEIVGKVAVAALTVVAIGATLATVVIIAGFLLCEFTSFCFLPSISFAGLGDDNLEEAVRAYMAPDKLASLSNFVISSIEKFSKKHKYKEQT